MPFEDTIKKITKHISVNPAPSSRSVSPNIPGAYPDNTMTDIRNNTETGNGRNHSRAHGHGHGGRTENGTNPNNNERAIGSLAQGASGNRSGRMDASPTLPSPTAPKGRMSSENVSVGHKQTGNSGPIQSNNRFDTLDGISNDFPTLKISAGRESSHDHPLTSSTYYKNNSGNRNESTVLPANPSSSATENRRPSANNPYPPSAAARGSTPGSRRRIHLQRMATQTIDAIDKGSYHSGGIEVSIRDKTEACIRETQFYAPDAHAITKWHTAGKSVNDNVPEDLRTKTHFSVLNISTLAAARLLETVYQLLPGSGGTNSNKCHTGVLNFASATKPGGGFQNGAEAQEETLARASTMYASLFKSEQAQKFYRLHERESKDKLPEYYTHAMIYSPGVLVIRDDEDGTWFPKPFAVDVLSCAAVNAGEVRRSAGLKTRSTRAAITETEINIEKEMAERMGRILCVFEQQGVKNLILGTFGTGVFQNKVDVVARIWVNLLQKPDARFHNVFDRVIFAITGEETFVEFQSALSAWGDKKKARAQGPSANNDLIDL